jgi:hypothetical protein
LALGLKIRLVTWIDNCFSFPRRPHLSRTKLSLTQPGLKPLAPLHLAPQSRWLEPQWLVALQYGAKLRDPMRGTLPRRKRYGAPEHATTLATATTNQIVAEQPQRPHPLATRRTSKPRPRTSIRKLPQMDADVLLDMAELKEEYCGFRSNYARRPQARNWDDRQVVAVFRYLTHTKLDKSEAAISAIPVPRRALPQRHLVRAAASLNSASFRPPPKLTKSRTAWWMTRHFGSGARAGRALTATKRQDRRRTPAKLLLPQTTPRLRGHGDDIRPFGDDQPRGIVLHFAHIS